MSEAIHRAEHAKRLLDDDLLKDALATIKAETQALFFALPTGDAEARESLHLMDKMRQQFENLLQLHIAGGEVAKFDLLNEAATQARLDAIQDKVRQR